MKKKQKKTQSFTVKKIKMALFNKSFIVQLKKTDRIFTRPADAVAN